MGASGTQNAASVSSACTASAGRSSNTCGGGFAPDAALVNYYWQGQFARCLSVCLAWFVPARETEPEPSHLLSSCHRLAGQL